LPLSIAKVQNAPLSSQLYREMILIGGLVAKA